MIDAVATEQPGSASDPGTDPSGTLDVPHADDGVGDAPAQDEAVGSGFSVRLEEFEYIFAPEQARECLPIIEEMPQLTLIGHSHLCKVFALTKNSVEELPPIDFVLEPDKKYVVSVGSVGQPRDYDNRASYTVFDTDKRIFEFKRVEYDIETAADKVLRARLERNFAHRLFIGV